MLQAKAASYLNSNETFFGGFQTLLAVCSENGIFVRMLTIFHIVFCLVVSIIGEAWTFSLQSLCFDLGLKEKEEKLLQTSPM